jgi:hypothetical protein
MFVAPAAPARRIAAVALLLLALVVSSPAAALPVTLVVDGGWTGFSWTGGLGPIDSPADGFQVTSATSVVIQITDCCVIGDRLEILVNNAVHTTTSATAPADDGVPSGAFNGPDSWADSRLSKVSFVLAPGTWDIDINVIDTNPIASSGNGFIQVLPEPDALLLLAAGLAALLWKSAPRPQLSARPSRPNR